MNAITSAPLRHYTTIDSTNLEATRLCAAGQRDAVWLIADQQTAGIGRENRKWVSELGNLYTTLVYPTAARLSEVPQLSIVAAVALFETFAQFVSSERIRIKWPNDLLIDGSKVSGILVQNIHVSPQLFAIGMGVNVAYAPSNMPYSVTCLNSSVVTSPQAVFAVLRERLATNLQLWGHGFGFADIRLKWMSYAKCTGQAVSVSNGQNVRTGKFIDMAMDGALQIALADGSNFVAYAGDVKFLESELQ